MENAAGARKSIWAGVAVFQGGSDDSLNADCGTEVERRAYDQVRLRK